MELDIVASVNLLVMICIFFLLVWGVKFSEMGMLKGFSLMGFS